MEYPAIRERVVRSDEFLVLKGIVENPDFRVPGDVERYFEALTKYIWDHKMFGAIYDLYRASTVIHGENGHVTGGVPAILQHTSDRVFSIPDLTTHFIEIFAEKIDGDQFRFVQVTYLEATFTGPCKYGRPGRQSMNYGNNMSICECLLQKIDGTWAITEEWCLGFDDFFKKLFY